MSLFCRSNVDFEYPNSIEDFDHLLQYFQRKRAPCDKNFLSLLSVAGTSIIMYHTKTFGLRGCTLKYQN